jgi:hypothetical protein
LQWEQAEQLRARNALQRAEAQNEQQEIQLNEALECERQQAGTLRDIQDAFAQEENQERQENFMQHSQELHEVVENARL